MALPARATALPPSTEVHKRAGSFRSWATHPWPARVQHGSVPAKGSLKYDDRIPPVGGTRPLHSPSVSNAALQAVLNECTGGVKTM
jgi:hypothetical protein